MINNLPACIFFVALLSAFSVPGEILSPDIVYLEGQTLYDSQYPFLGLGVTYMQALRHCKYEPSRLDKELAFLSACGFKYVRILSMVDWQDQEIPPVSHKNRQGQSIAAWPDYDARLQELVDAVYSHGMRTQLTLFADAQYIMPDREARRHHVRRVLHDLKDRDEKIILYEIANEAWQNGFPGKKGCRTFKI